MFFVANFLCFNSAISRKFILEFLVLIIILLLSGCFCFASLSSIDVVLLEFFLFFHKLKVVLMCDSLDPGSWIM